MNPALMKNYNNMKDSLNGRKEELIDSRGGAAFDKTVQTESGGRSTECLISIFTVLCLLFHFPLSLTPLLNTHTAKLSIDFSHPDVKTILLQNSTFVCTSLL